VKIIKSPRGIVLPKQVRQDPSYSPFFHVHAHSRYSWKDALPEVKDMVAKAVSLGQPALALTDHGNMAGTVQLYKECKKAGIIPFPGSEVYFVKDRADKNAKRYHLGLLAVDLDGYRALARLSTKSHTRENFHHKPLVDWADLAEWKEYGWTTGLALTTGCYFGLLIQTLISEGPQAANHVLLRFASLFPNTFVELQNHKIEQVPMSEDEIAVALFDMASKNGLPITIAQDAHYCETSDKAMHETLKRVVAFGPDTDDAVFPGDGFHLAEAEWVRAHHQDRHWEEAEAGWKHLLALNTLAIPELDTYRYNIPKVSETPDVDLQRRCNEALRSRNLPRPYQDRLDSELSIVRDTGMAGYLLLVAEVTDWCAMHGVFTQARGSASGSIICWLLGITQCDPIRYHLRFERFISRDRTKPPDIDLDVEDSRRQDLIDWLKTRFTVAQIGTFLTYGLNDEDDNGETGRGSLIIAYKSVAKKQGVDKETLAKITTISDIPDEWRDRLLALAETTTCKAVGTHAGGLIVTTTQEEMDDLVPLMMIPIKKEPGYRYVSQYTMNDVEALGLVKLDVLGLRTLSLLRRCVELAGHDVREGLEWIPLDDTRTFTAIRNGSTSGVFQLEGGTAQRGCKELKVRSLKDIIVIMALYRTAVMKSGGKDTYIARREGREKVPDYHPLIMKNVKETFGVIIFQEQVVSILRDLGMDPDELTSFLKAIKGSQKADIKKAAVTMAAAREQVWEMCKGFEISSEDFAYIWKAIEGFAEYGFNRAHATSYGLTAYRCAYLKTHYPLEFATALLQTSEGTKKEAMYISAVRQMGISIRRPHVNISGMSYSIDRRARSVRKGLVSILGIGERTATELEACAPFTSLEDIIERCHPQKVNGGKTYKKNGFLNGHLLKLKEAGALEGLIHD
jgi:DNA polymerase-3 subunit alpha